jgi:hypothetical protein
MDDSEAKQLLDHGYILMLDGDFKAAAIVFQNVLDQSPIHTPREIARRNLEWYCAPFDAIVAELRHSPYPIAIDPLIVRVLSLEAMPPADRQANVKTFARELAKVRTVLRITPDLWIERSQFQSAIRGGLDRLRSPIKLADFITRLFETLGGPVLAPDSTMLTEFESELTDNPSVRLLDNGCLFPIATLVAFLEQLADATDRAHQPIRLSTVIPMDWPPAVLRDLDLAALDRWLYIRSDARLIAVADQYWLKVYASDLSSVAFSSSFHEAFVPLNTETLLKRHLFVDGDAPALYPAYVQAQRPLLSRNTALIAIDADLWLLTNSASQLELRAVTRFTQFGYPQSLQAVLEYIYDEAHISQLAPPQLDTWLTARLRSINGLVQLTAGFWMHRAALNRFLEEAYERLGLGNPRDAHTLLTDWLAALDLPAGLARPLLNDAYSAMSVDVRFIHVDDAGHWRALPAGDPLNDHAYHVLLAEHRPVSLGELRSGVLKRFGFKPALNLASDKRFVQLPNGHWMLAEWKFINDLAAAYMSLYRMPLSESNIIYEVCRRNGLAVESVIFDPQDDPRFVLVGNKWIFRPPAKQLTDAMLDRIVQGAINGTWGVPLSKLVADALHDAPSSFRDIESLLTADGRLILWDGLWYPRAEVFYYVTPDDLARIKQHLREAGVPLSLVALAALVDRPWGLTDLESQLCADAEFVNLGTAGWTLAALVPPSGGRDRETNYPIRSGKYVPVFDPALLAISDDAPASLPPKAGPAPGLPARHRQRITITLAFEDIRDGSLSLTAPLRNLLSQNATDASISLVDERGSRFPGWRDSDHSLLYGFKAWFTERDLTYGDKLRLARAETGDELLIQPTGERNVQVRQEGLSREQVQDLRENARRAGRSYHDLLVDVLRHFNRPLHVDDLWRLVNYRRVSRKSTLYTILASRPYFVSDGAGHWRYDEQEYARMIRELEKQVTSLKDANAKLRSALEASVQQATEAAVLQRDFAQYRDQLTANQAEVARLTASLQQAQTDASGAQQLAHANRHLSIELETLNSKLQSLRVSEQEWQQLADDTQASLDAAKANADVERQSREELKSQFAALQASSAIVGADLRAVKEQHAQLELKYARLREEHAVATQTATDFTRALTEHTTASFELNGALAAARASLDAKQVRVATLEAASAESQRQLAALGAQTESQAVTLANLDARFRAATQTVAYQQSELDRIRAHGEELQTMIHVVTVDRDTEQQKRMVFEAQLTDVRAEQQASAQQLAALRAKLDQALVEQSALRASLAECSTTLTGAKMQSADLQRHVAEKAADYDGLRAAHEAAQSTMRDLEAQYASLRADQGRTASVLATIPGRIAAWYARSRQITHN